MSSNILNLVSEETFSEKMDALIEAVGDSSPGSTTSSNGLVYEQYDVQIPTNIPGYVRGVACGQVGDITRYVAVFGYHPSADAPEDDYQAQDFQNSHYNTASNSFMYSDDGYTWIQVSLPQAYNWVDVCYAGSDPVYGTFSNEFIALAGPTWWFDDMFDYTMKFNEDPCLIARSKDGIHWTFDTTTLGMQAKWSAMSTYGGALAVVARNSSKISINGQLYDLPETMDLVSVSLGYGERGWLCCTAIEAGRAITAQSSWNEDLQQYVYEFKDCTIELLPANSFTHVAIIDNSYINTIQAYGFNSVATRDSDGSWNLTTPEIYGAVHDLAFNLDLDPDIYPYEVLMIADSSLWRLRGSDVTRLKYFDLDLSASAIVICNNLYIILSTSYTQNTTVTISRDCGLTWSSSWRSLTQSGADVSAEVADVLWPTILPQVRSEIPDTNKYLYIEEPSYPSVKLHYEELCYNKQLGRVACRRDYLMFSDDDGKTIKQYEGSPVSGSLIGAVGQVFIFESEVWHDEYNEVTETDEFGNEYTYTDAVTVIDGAVFTATSLNSYQSPINCLFVNEARDQEISVPPAQFKFFSGYYENQERALLIGSYQVNITDEKGNSTAVDKLFSAHSDDGLVWIVHDDLLPFSSVPHVVYGNKAFHAYCDGHYFRSYDGIEWTDMGATENEISCAARDVFVKVTRGTTVAEYLGERSLIYWSEDGLNWTLTELPTDVPHWGYSGAFTGVCYFHDMFVLLPVVGIAAYSYDGKTWDWLDWGGESYAWGDDPRYTYLDQSSDSLFILYQGYGGRSVQVIHKVNNEPYIPTDVGLMEADELVSQRISKRALFDNTSTRTICIPRSYWNSDKTATMILDKYDITPTDIILVASHPDSLDAYSDAEISCIEQDYGKLTFRCKRVPTTDVYVNIVNMTCFGKDDANKEQVWIDQPTLTPDEEYEEEV